MRLVFAAAILTILCVAAIFAEELRLPSTVPAISAKHDHRTSENKEKERTNKTHGTKEFPVVVEALESKSDAAEKERNATHRSQEIANSRSTNQLTGGLLAVAFFQVCLFIWQLCLMQRNIKDTRKAADAAQKSANALIASERPFLTVSIACKFDDIKSMKQTVHCTCNILNEGKSPAIINFIDFKIMEAGETDFSLEPGGQDTARIVLGVYDGEIIEREKTFSVKILNGKLFCYGVIEYSGIEGIATIDSRWKTEFHHVYINPPGSFHRSNNTERNRYT
jgi:hypothetical protein